MKRAIPSRSRNSSIRIRRVRAGRPRAAMQIISAAIAFSGTYQALGQAQNLFWDPNGTAAGAATAASFAAGTWNATNLNWNTDSGGTTAPIAWTPGGTANFSAGSNATGAFTVTVAGTQVFSGLNVGTGSITLAGTGILSYAPTDFATAWTVNTPLIINVPIAEDPTSAANTSDTLLIFSGNGAVTLGGSNSFTQSIVVGNGGLTITNGSALGDNAGTTSVTTNNGAARTLTFSGGINSGENIFLAGGQLSGSAASNTASGTITMQGGGTGDFINVASGGTLSLPGLIQDGGASQLYKLGAGTAILTGSSNYGGTLTVSGGTLLVQGSGTLGNVGQVNVAGTASAAGNLSVKATAKITANNNNGIVVGLRANQATYSAGTNTPIVSSLTIDKSGTLSSDNIDDNTNINLAGAGALNLVGNAAASSETIGNVSVLGGADAQYFGNNFVNATGGAGAMTLTANSFSRGTASIVTFRGTNLGAASGANAVEIKFTTAPTTLGGGGAAGTPTISIMPGVLSDNVITSNGFSGNINNSNGLGSGFATYDPTVGVRALTASEYSSTFATNNNVSATSGASVSSNVTINSLRLTGAGANVSIGSSNTLGINSGMILANTTATGNVGISGGTIDFQGREPIVINRNAMTISSNLTNGSGFTKHGLGTLTLTGSGAGLHGNTYLEEGATIISSGDALGDGRTSIATGATLELTNNIAVSHNIALGGTYTSLNGTQFSGAATLDTVNGFSSIGGNVGNLESLSGNNTINGNVELTGAALIGDPGGNPGNNIANTGLNTIGVAAGANLTINGQITKTSGAGSIVKIGDGTLTLTQSSSGITLFRIFGGVVNVSGPNANGALGNTFPSVLPLANTRSTIGFSNDVKYTNTDSDMGQMSGWGEGSLGIIDNFGGSNRYDSGLTTQIARGNFNTLTPTYIGSQDGTLTLNGAFNSGNNTTPRRVIKVGGGTIVMGNNWNYLGPTEIQAGALVLGSNSGGDATGVGAFNQNAKNVDHANFLSIFSGASLVVDDTGHAETFGSNDRFGNNGGTSPLLMGGEFKVIGNNGGADNYNVPSSGNGAFTLLGSTTLTVSQPAGGSQTILQLNHGRAANDYTLLVRGNSLGTPGGGIDNEITNTVAPTLVGSGSGTGAETKIVPWVFGDTSETGGGSDLVTYGVTGFIPLTASQYDSTFSGSLPGSDTNSNFKIALDQNPTADSGVNGLVVGAANLNLGNTTLNVKSGAVLMAAGAGTTSFSGGTLAFGAAEGIIHTATGHDTIISSVITGSGGLTKSGPAKLTVSANNTFTGPVALNGGILVASSDTNLGNSSNAVIMSSGALQPAPAYTSTSRNFTLNSKSGGFDIEGSQSFTIAGTISGSNTYAPLVKFGTGTLVLSPPVSNAWIGGAVVKGGTLRIAADSALGSNSTVAANNDNVVNPGAAIPLELDGGTLSFSASTGLGQRSIYLGKNNGTISVDAGATVTYDFATGIDRGLIPFFGPGTFNKVGDGTFAFLSNSPNYNGGTDIKGGTIRVDVANPFPTGGLSRIVRIDGGRLLLNFNGTESAGFVQLGDGGTLASSSTSTYAATAVVGYPQVENSASVTLSGLSAANVLTINSQMSNLDPNNIVAPTVNIRGAGTVYLLSQPVPNFVANYNIDGSTLRINDQNAALGVQTNPVSFSTSGGTLEMRLSASGTGKTYNNPVTLNGNGTFVESTTTTTTFTGATNTFGALTVLADATLTSTNTNGATNGVTTGNVGLVFPSASLSGNLTVNVVNPTATGSIGTVAIGTAGGAGLSEAVAGKNLTKTGPGVLTLRGSSTYTGTTTVNAGTLILSQDAAWGAALNGPGATTITAPGKLVFDYTGNAGTNPVSTLRTKLQGSYGSNFTSGQFRTAGDATHGLGYFDNGTSNVLVRYTYYGDANLDGKVNTADFTALAAAFNSASGTWQTGDFNYDGVVNLLDFNAVAVNFGAAALPGSDLSLSPSLGTLVPEPGSLSLLALGVATLAGRRRRK